jgi:hypothetical protein
MSSSPREDNISDEIFNLRRKMRDLAALSTMSASWASYDQERIADSLADVLMEALSLDLIYIKFAGNDPKSGTEVARCSRISDSVENRDAISRSIHTWLSEPFESSSVIPHPFQKGMLSVTYALFGYLGTTKISNAGLLFVVIFSFIYSGVIAGFMRERKPGYFAARQDENSGAQRMERARICGL